MTSPRKGMTPKKSGEWGSDKPGKAPRPGPKEPTGPKAQQPKQGAVKLGPSAYALVKYVRTGKWEVEIVSVDEVVAKPPEGVPTLELELPNNVLTQGKYKEVKK